MCHLFCENVSTSLPAVLLLGDDIADVEQVSSAGAVRACVLPLITSITDALTTIISNGQVCCSAIESQIAAVQNTLSNGTSTAVSALDTCCSKLDTHLVPVGIGIAAAESIAEAVQMILMRVVVLSKAS